MPSDQYIQGYIMESRTRPADVHQVSDAKPAAILTGVASPNTEGVGISHEFGWICLSHGKSIQFSRILLHSEIVPLLYSKFNRQREEKFESRYWRHTAARIPRRRLCTIHTLLSISTLSTMIHLIVTNANHLNSSQ